MKTLRECIADAETKKVALGHFNVSDTEQLHAIVRAARELDVPVIIGTSEGERDFVGVRQAAVLVKSMREEFDHPIFLNADHTYSFERCKEAIDAGYDAVIFDGVKLSLEENIAETRRVVEYARSVNPEIIVEGEIGYIGTSSKMLDELPEGVDPEGAVTTEEEIGRYVAETGVDLVAPAVGNLHGMLKSGKNPELNIEQITKLHEAGGVPLVLHGGSGISDEDFVAAIEAGISTVHINTEIRVAYRKGIEAGLKENPGEIAPYRFMKQGVEGVREVVEQRLKLFNRM
ncbi:MAG: class II fructose-bisphosphate aldolase [Candidatus Pacebacteria bacterium]|nr:class II fructose-bisphosphate aldolase [Candidatus Paceibacterota bacterium]